MEGVKLKGILEGRNIIYKSFRGFFDSQISGFKSKGIESPFLATPEEIALIRLEDIDSEESRTSYAPVKMKGKATIITANSPWLTNEYFAKVAMDANDSEEFPTMPSWFYEVLESEAKNQRGLAPEDRTVHMMEGEPDGRGYIRLTPEMDDTRFLLKKFTKRYFRKFNHKSIYFSDLFGNFPENKTIVNSLMFENIQSSEFVANYSNFNCRTNALGILYEKIGAVQKNSKYNLTNVNDAIKSSIPSVFEDLGIPALEKIVSVPLRKETLKNLRDKPFY